MAENMFTPKTTAGIIGVTERTLYQWRQDGIGPEWVETNGRFHYPEKGIKKWQREHGAQPLSARK